MLNFFSEITKFLGPKKVSLSFELGYFFYCHCKIKFKRWPTLFLALILHFCKAITGQGFGVRLGSRNHMFLGRLRTEVVFLNMLRAEPLFRCAGVGMEFVFFFGHFYPNFQYIAGIYSHVYHLNDLKISKQK